MMKVDKIGENEVCPECGGRLLGWRWYPEVRRCRICNVEWPYRGLEELVAEEREVRGLDL